tara:strand:- start:805 stop:2103 length:1299 start_codon:yes stop_codon:yes gene_type:complete
LFLIIPNYFNYESRIDAIKSHIIKNYNIEINKYEKIKFNTFPLPNLDIQNVDIYFKSSKIRSRTKNLRIYPKFLSIYNYNQFNTNKLVLKNNNITLNSSDIRSFIDYNLKQKEKIIFDNLSLDIKDQDKLIIRFKNIKFSNFGFNKDLITGKIFDKEFEVKIKKDLKNLSFKLLNTGVNADIHFEENKKNNSIAGIFKSKILSSNLKFNFEYDNKILIILNSYFRNKNISFKNESSVVFDPYFNINSKFDIQNINFQIIDNINFNNILEAKSLIKRINSQNEINFISKKFSRNLIDKLNLKIDIAYGRVNFIKQFSISNSFFKCQGNTNLIEEYPLLFFDCSVTSEDKLKLLKKFSVKVDNKIKILKLNVSGNLNILNKKINFKKINMNDDYRASNEDLKYFKDIFENIIFNESFLKIFSKKKIKDFILEIS